MAVARKTYTASLLSSSVLRKRTAATIPARLNARATLYFTSSTMPATTAGSTTSSCTTDCWYPRLARVSWYTQATGSDSSTADRMATPTARASVPSSSCMTGMPLPVTCSAATQQRLEGGRDGRVVARQPAPDRHGTTDQHHIVQDGAYDQPSGGTALQRGIRHARSPDGRPIARHHVCDARARQVSCRLRRPAMCGAETAPCCHRPVPSISPHDPTTPDTGPSPRRPRDHRRDRRHRRPADAGGDDCHGPGTGTTTGPRVPTRAATRNATRRATRRGRATVAHRPDRRRSVSRRLPHAIGRRS